MTITGTVNLGTTADTVAGGPAAGLYFVDVGNGVTPMLISPGGSQGFSVKKKVVCGSGSISFTPSSHLPHADGSSQTGSAATVTVPDCCVPMLQRTGDVIEVVPAASGLSNTTNNNDSYGACANHSYTVQNTMGRNVTITVAGTVDDDIAFNGAIFEPGAHVALFGGRHYWTDDNPCGRANGAHGFTYTHILSPGQTLTITAMDNGGGGWVNADISVAW